MTRSRAALEADRAQEKIVYGGRVWQIWLMIGLLAVGVWLSDSFDVKGLYIIAGVAAWIAFVIHVSFTAVLQELYELNDQIAGRKDEFRALVHNKAEPLVS